MPYCAVFNCKSNSKVDRDVSWFRLPHADRDQARYKTWLHYCCRKDFVPSSHSRLCSRHFTSAQLSRNPAYYAMFGFDSVKPALKTDAVPDVVWNYGGVQPAACVTPVINTPTPKPRSAVLKRRRLQVLHEVLNIQNSDHGETTCTSDPDCDVHVGSTSSADQHQRLCTEDKGIQATVVPSTRTRRIQVGKPKVSVKFSTIGIQCNIEEELSLPCSCNCTCNCSSYPSDEDMCESESDECLNDSRTSSFDESCLDHSLDFDSDYDPDNSLEDVDDDDNELDDIQEGDVENYRISATDNQQDEKYYIVSESSLLQLLNVCRKCYLEAIPIIEYSRGTMISVISTCVQGHINKWTSQSMFSKMPWFNLLLSSAILTSGSNTSKVLRCLSQAKVQCISKRTVSRLQALYTIPAIMQVYKNQQLQILDTLKDKPHVTLGGDGRCDSPGFSAKYGSYSLMDLETNKIVDMQLIQCNEVGGSTHMELEGLKRGLDTLKDRGIVVQDLVTDRHVMIKSYMKQHCPNINHYFDVWHITKGISKKLEAASKRKGCDTIRHWIKSIVNHGYWVAATSNDNQDLKLEKWKSVSNHIINRHTHDSELFPACLHDEVDDLEWMISGSRCHKLVKEIVESPYLLRDIPKLSPRHQTYGIEVFHSVVNQFAPKSTHFFYSAMIARLYTAALHFNENGKRVQATRQDGTAIWYQSYPKAKKGTECVAKPRKVPPTYDYIELVMGCVIERRQDFPTLAVAREDIMNGHKSVQPGAVTAGFTKFQIEELIAKRTSRFAVI